MTRESSQPLLHFSDLQINVYISLIAANLLYGVLHPENIVIAASGVLFFTLAALRSLRTST